MVLEDHKETCALLTASLEEEGFQVFCEGTVAAAKGFLKRELPSLVVLDLALPDGDGLQVCAWMKRDGRLENVPIIAFTGRDQLKDKKKGFAAGVDQYLTKPIDMGEFVMWAKALLRRSGAVKGAGIITADDLEIDSGAQLLKYKGRVLENLTWREFSLLAALVKNSPRLLSRNDILSEIWHTVAVPNLVDTHMFNLRRKLPHGLSERIQSVPGKGFRYFAGD